MDLILTNFRCWEEKKFNFPDKGICLINGRSGKGKSTILNSILYAITGKLKNISTFNKKSSKVELIIDNIKITRSRGPNRLIVNVDNNINKKIYEDDEAQEIINSIFGSEFSNTSYIDQDNINSFVYLSASEKIEFLEKLLLSQSGINIEKIKENIKNNISQTKTDHTSEDSKLSTLKDVLKGMKYDDSIDKEDLLISKIKINEENFEKMYEKVKNNLEVSEKNKKIIQTKLERAEEESKKYFSFIEKKKIAESRLNDILSDITNISKYPQSLEEIKKMIHVLEKDKEECINKKEYIENVKKLKEVKDKYLNLSESQQKEIEILNNELKKYIFTDKKVLETLGKAKELIQKINKIEDDIKNYSSIEEYQEEISYLKQKLREDKDLFKSIQEMKNVYQCPSCHTHLKLDKKQLIIFSDKNNHKNNEDILKREIEEKEKQLEKKQRELISIEKKEDEYNELFDQYEEMVKSYSKSLVGEQDIEKELKKLESDNKKYEEFFRKIKNVENDRLLPSLEKEIFILEKKIKDENDKNNEKYENNYDYEEIMTKLTFYKNKYDTLKVLYNKKENIEKELYEFSEIKDKNFEETIKTEREKLNEYTKKIESYRSYLDQLSSWNIKNQSNKKYKEIQDSIIYSEEVKNLLSDRMRGLVKLREHLKNAEKKCITDFIDSLNEHASIYIEQFFQDEDIKVELKTTQETKSTGKEKMSLNFEINYRQMIGDLSYLSGGEKDRVNLAFTLAFSELVDNRILLLDECISSLDAETTNIVLENLKEKYKGKLVLLVSHQANLGFFDSVLNI